MVSMGLCLVGNLGGGFYTPSVGAGHHFVCSGFHLADIWLWVIGAGSKAGSGAGVLGSGMGSAGLLG